MNSWEDSELEYSRNLINKLHVLLNRLGDLPQKFIDNVRTVQDDFLQEFSSTTQVVVNLCAKILMTDIRKPPTRDPPLALKEKGSETYSSDSETIRKSKRKEKNIVDSEHDEKINKCQREFYELKNAQEGMWIALLLTNNKYTELLHSFDKTQILLSQKNQMLNMCNSLLKDNQIYQNYLTSFGNKQTLTINENIPFCGLLTSNEIIQVKEWTQCKSFSLLYHDVTLPKEPLYSQNGVVSFMRNHQQSVFGFFTKASSIQPTTHWYLSKDYDFCFSLRSLFSKEPLMLLRKKDGKVEQGSSSEYIPLTLIEMSNSSAKEFIYLSLN
ncbi:hypothetical protein EDI_246500 [Entamoeba dispar SAW760]|uniref:TLDc domain-containing protein n=1 Tax=Entamoeba dispar (strain ATCC PRA-260 / SAW760) TaxID=370354 RepID=B0EEQ8_ENTDS|nr:uncharacterized protein EDI_246500 [Entamoeba dispar SAW760]EDR27034.1 hypothetical protein EDI_246500 [Entamoeba dispar SAW760]|eukprot:EDR27034.1 hypothetical protein EDI_246500 [Entamoeba dispar SAW760]